MPTRFLIDGLGDVTDITVLQGTELETQLGGTPSPGVMIMRDIGQYPTDFVTGARVTVDRGPSTPILWSGYLMRAARRFWFDVDDPDKLQRQWRLALADINLLFTRRVVFNQAVPKRIKGPKYVADTYDDDVLAVLLNDWLDLSTDDLDITSRINRVGTINDGQTTYPWNGGMLWRDAMANIAQLPAAAWGISPAREVIYVDVDDENAPFILSDVPGPGIVGYREMELIRDGSKLINDVFCWGFGLGASSGVFKRRQNTSSMDAHGVWQDSITSYAVWKQSTIDRIASSIINGSPQSKRGYAIDRVSANCTIFEDGLVLGDRVRFISNIWGFDDVLPVRKVNMTFPNLTDVRYKLSLSHEADRWGFEDPVPPIKYPRPDPIDGPIIDIPGPTEPGSCDDVCGITDSFSRTTTTDWGTSDAGIAWSTNNDGLGAYVTEVTTGAGHLFVPDNAGNIYANLVFPHGQSFSMVHRFKVSDNGSGWSLFFGMGTGATPRYWTIAKDTALGSGVWLALAHLFPASSGLNAQALFSGFVPDTWYWARWTCVGGVAQTLTIWEDGSTEPGTPTLTDDLSAAGALMSYGFYIDADSAISGAGDIDVWVDDLSIDGIDACGDWPSGISDVDTVWDQSGPSNQYGYPWGHNWGSLAFDFPALPYNYDTEVGVAGGLGYLQINPGNSSINVGASCHLLTDGWNDGAGKFTATMRFRWQGNASTYWTVGVHGSDNFSFDRWVLDDTYVYDYQSSGESPGTTVVPYPFGVMTTGQWYMMKWDYYSVPGPTYPYGGYTRVKFWRDGDPEPADWLISSEGAGGAGTPLTGGPDYFYMTILSPGGTGYQVRMDVDYVDFSYDGMPCGPGCGSSAVTFDDFERTVDPGWGTATIGEDWQFPLSAQETFFSVSGGAGLADQSPADTFGNLTASLPMPAFGNVLLAPILIHAIFRQHAPTFLNASTLFVENGFYLTDQADLGTGADWATIDVFYDNTGLNPAHWRLFPDATWVTVSDYQEYLFTAGQYTGNVHVMLRVSGYGVQGKIWNDGDPEPSDWQAWALATLPVDWTPTFFSIQPRAGHEAGQLFELLSVDYTICDGLFAGSGVPTSGPYCEYVDSSAGGTVFTTAVPFVAGSSTVRVNGTTYRLNTDYTESPGAGIITLSEAVASGVSIYVCYTVA